MAKDKSESERKEKKEKKDKKRKHDEADEDVEVVAEKKKKDKKRKSIDVEEDVSMGGTEVAMAVKDEDGEDKKTVIKVDVPLAALVPFANPLCDEKAQKKVLKGVKKAAKSKTLKRGVKESVKAIRKSPLATPTSHTSTPPAIVILAADISPMDVISHIPVLCEDHGIPYVYVPSRAELGAASSTKRPTSIVMITQKTGKKDSEAGEEWAETYTDLSKVVAKLGQYVKV